MQNVKDTLLSPVLLIFWGLVLIVAVGFVSWLIAARHRLQRAKRAAHLKAQARAKAVSEGKLGDEEKSKGKKPGCIGRAFNRITEEYKKNSDKVHMNKDGSVTFFKTHKEQVPPKTITVVKDTDNGVAQIREITTTVISTVAVTETKVTVRPSNILFKMITFWQSESVTVKSLVSFMQISGTSRDRVSF